MTADEQREVCEFLGIPKVLPPCECPRGGGCVCYRTKVYPYLLDGDGLLLMVEALRRKEMRWDHMSMQSDTCPYGAAVFAPDEHRWGKHCYAPTLPEALFRAVLELARKEKG